VEEGLVFRRRRCIVVDCTRWEEEGGVEGVSSQGVSNFVDEVSRFSGSVLVVQVLGNCKIFITMTRMEVGMLMEGCVGGCN